MNLGGWERERERETETETETETDRQTETQRDTERETERERERESHSLHKEPIGCIRDPPPSPLSQPNLNFGPCC